MIDSTVTEHFEILRVAFRPSLRIRRVERIGHAHAFDRFLLDPVDFVRCLDAGGFKDRWHDVDHVMELGANTTRVLDVTGPRDAHALPGAAEMRGNLFGPFERR